MTVPPSPQSVINILDRKIGNNNKQSVFNWCSSNWRPIIAELVSTTFLLLLGCMTTIPIDGLPYQNPMYGPFGFGFIVMVNIQIFGHISGAFMNPAVTLAAVLYGKTSVPTGVAFVIAQCAGACLGYGILMTVSPILIAESGICVTQIHQGLSPWRAVGIEIILTSALNFLNCAVWDPVNEDKLDSIPIKFGLAIAGLSLAGGPWTGASMNPARSLGPAAWTGQWAHQWIYWVGPLIGGILPTLVYKHTFLRVKSKTEQSQQ